MNDFLAACVVFVLLCASAVFGMMVARALPERHRGRDTFDLMSLVIGMMVTFSALILSLVMASVKTGFDAAAHDRRHDALVLTELDLCLRDVGPLADAARAAIRSYTAGVIASTWPDEPKPTGVSYPTLRPGVGASPVLGNLMHNARLEFFRINPSDPTEARIANECRQDFNDFQVARYAVIQDIQEGISVPFYKMMVLWLMLLFGGFGLIAPRHRLAVITVALCAFSLSTAIFVIDDLASPYGGLFAVSSDSMRAALASMMQP
jgi:ABC-type amino acid transport system permease subunit